MWYRTLLPLGLAALCFGVGAPAFGQAPFVRVVSEKADIPADRAVEDLLVVDGTLTLDGVVRGHLFAIDSEVNIGPDAIVLGSVSLMRGQVQIAAKARLPEQVRLEATHVHGGNLPAGERRVLPGGTTLIQSSNQSSDIAVELMKDIVTFDRFSPPDAAAVRDLRGWHPGLDLTVKRFAERSPKLVVGGVTRLSFVSDKVEGSFQRGYRGPQGAVLLTGVKLIDTPTAEALWAQVASVEDRAGVELSVHSDLGPGAHWFFRKKGRYVMLWQRGPWFFGVESRLAQPEASAQQQKRFLDAILASLRQGLSPVAGAAPVTRGER